MTTLYAPIAILLLYLQTLYNIIVLTFVIAISLFPGALIPKVGEGVENVDGREGWPRRRLYYYTKVGSRDRGLVAERGSLESLTDVNHTLCEVKPRASSGALPSDRLNYRFKMGDTKRRTN